MENVMAYTPGDRKSEDIFVMRWMRTIENGFNQKRNDLDEKEGIHLKMIA